MILPGWHGLQQVKLVSQPQLGSLVTRRGRLRLESGSGLYFVDDVVADLGFPELAQHAQR